LALNPNLEMHHYYRANAFMHLGLLDRIDAEVQEGLERNREGGQSKLDGLGPQAFGAFFSSDFPRAVRLLEEWLRGRSMRTYWAHGLTLYYLGQHARSVALLEEAARSAAAPAAARGRAALASVLAALGERTRAEKLIAHRDRGPYIDHHVANSLGAATLSLANATKPCAGYGRRRRPDCRAIPGIARDPLLGSAPERSAVPALPGGRAER